MFETWVGGGSISGRGGGERLVLLPRDWSADEAKAIICRRWFLSLLIQHDKKLPTNQCTISRIIFQKQD